MAVACLKPPWMDHSRALALKFGAPTNRFTEIIYETRAITAETALLSGRRLGTIAKLWMNLQTAYALEEARQRLPASV